MRAAGEAVQHADGKRGVGVRVARSSVRGIEADGVRMRVRMRVDVRAVRVRMCVDTSGEGAMQAPDADAPRRPACRASTRQGRSRPLVPPARGRSR